MSSFYFKYKRIVLVDSADLCYAEIPLDEHAILLGKGNVGKSSILNALRLFLLPEVNFANCENKFAFRTPDKDSYYTKDQSFQHYFPSPNSFLILEVENFTGRHCQILYREKGYQYRRIFVPLPYKKIRSLFWYCCDDEDGIGQAVEGLTSGSVIKKTKRLASKSLVISDMSKLKQLLYANDLLDDEKTRYSLFPLIEKGESNVDSLRALFLLLFDMNANSKAMSTAVANIIEADNKSSEENLDFNIDDFLNKHEALKEEDELLTSIKNKRSVFNKLQSDYNEYIKLSETDKKYLFFVSKLEDEKSQTIKAKKEIDDQIAPLQADMKKHEKETNKIKKKLLKIDGKIDGKKEDLEKAEDDFEKATELHQQFYSSKTISEAIEEAKKEYEENNDIWHALTSEIESEKQRNELNHEIEKSQKLLKNLKESSENQQFLLTEQLSESVLEPLSALNKKLLRANPKRLLKQEEIDKITNFTTLFRESNDSFNWFDILFDKQSINITEDLEEDYRQEEKNLVDYQKKLKILEKPSGSHHRQQDIKDLELKLKDSEKRYEDLKKYHISKANINTCKSDLDGLNVDKKNLTAEETLNQSNFDNADKKYKLLEPKQKTYEEKLQKIVDLKQRCSSIKRRYTRLEKLSSRLETDDVIEIEISQQVLDTIEEELHNYGELRNKIINGLKSFVSQKVIEDEDNIQVDAPKSNAIKSTFKRLQEVFEELPQKKSVLDNQIKIHNQSVSQYSNVLEKHAEHIDLFKDTLNREFTNITINDLEKIEVNIEIDRRFKNLVAEIKKADLHSEQQLSDRFYDRLKVFVKSFFNDKADVRLTMDQIIIGLHYRIKKTGSNNWQDKKQSNSTTALINLELVQLLLSRIKKSGCDVTFPLIHDELAEINIDQFDWLLNHLTTQGFKLFSAATYSTSPELIHKIKNYHEIGSMKTAKSYSAERTVVYWNGSEKFINSDSPDLNSISLAEQSKLELPSS